MMALLSLHGLPDAAPRYAPEDPPRATSQRRYDLSLPNILPFALGCFVGLGRADRPVRNGR
ncbi:MAG TPA: hypothetical protein VNS99_12985, partial [Gaiellales bacterium]|nr:hypothetical protein [Gaiellales bacterium]